ncbi:MAG TPA: polyphosphate kinase 2 family protein [Acidimicrobiia bacterium]|nr:polyphosphate kinase 2 family protein [Acidimicrobiia bacterium]
MDRYRVPEASPVDLSTWDPADTGEYEDGKEAAQDRLDELTGRLEVLQELLFADGRHRLLVVLQATDTGGKDGVIRRVFEGVNPAGVKVASFKQPTLPELAHDYLWRVHPHVPGNGEIVIFNRSHYEDVLIVRVWEMVTRERWEKRYRHIVEFERLLADEGTTILKFFLHISKDEQRQRLQERIDQPEKHWKFDPGDVKQRGRWDDYQQAFAEMLSRTSTAYAPWYIVPSNRKWYRDLVVSTVLVKALEELDLRYPEAETDLTGLVID